MDNDLEFRVAAAEAYIARLETDKDSLMALAVALLRREGGQMVIPDSEIEPCEGQEFQICTLRTADDLATEIRLEEASR